MASQSGPHQEKTSTRPTSTFHVSPLLFASVANVSLTTVADVSAVMALVTYILLAALYSGLNSRFHPEILGITASKALAVVLLDFCFVKAGCYILNIPVSP